MKRVLLVGIGLFVLVVGSTALAFQVKVESLTGEVTVQAKGSDDSTRVKAGQVIRQGDTVKTGADSTVSLVTDAGDTLYLTNFTVMTVGEASLQKTSVSLGNGRLYCVVRKLMARESFTVRTPTALAAIRGTTFQAEAAPGKESFKCIEGEIELTFGDTTITLQSGEKVDITKEGAEWEMKIPPGEVFEIKKDAQKLKSLTGNNKLTRNYLKMVRRLAAFKPGKKLGKELTTIKPKVGKDVNLPTQEKEKASEVAGPVRGARSRVVKRATAEEGKEKPGGAKGPKQKKKGGEEVDVVVTGSVSVSFVGQAVEAIGEKMMAQEQEKYEKGKGTGVEGGAKKEESAKGQEKAEAGEKEKVTQEEKASKEEKVAQEEKVAEEKEAAEEKEIAEEVEKEEAAEEEAAKEESTPEEKKIAEEVEKEEAAQEEAAKEEAAADEEKAAEEEAAAEVEEPAGEEIAQVEPEVEEMEEAEPEVEEMAQVEPEVVQTDEVSGIFEEGLDSPVSFDLINRSDVIGINILVETSEAGNRGF